MPTEASSHHPSGKLRHWLQKLQVAKKTVSQAERRGGFQGASDRCTPSLVLSHPFSPPQETTGCLEASSIFHLFQVLNDLRCAALREHCV